MNGIAQLEFELTYYYSAVKRFNHDITRTPPIWCQVCCINLCGEDWTFFWKVFLFYFPFIYCGTSCCFFAFRSIRDDALFDFLEFLLEGNRVCACLAVFVEVQVYISSIFMAQGCMSVSRILDIGISASLLMGSIRSLKVFISFCFSWERSLYLGVNVLLCAGLLGQIFTFIESCRESLSCRRIREVSFASAYWLSTVVVLNAPGTNLKPSS